MLDIAFLSCLNVPTPLTQPMVLRFLCKADQSFLEYKYLGDSGAKNHQKKANTVIIKHGPNPYFHDLPPK